MVRFLGFAGRGIGRGGNRKADFIIPHVKFALILALRAIYHTPQRLPSWARFCCTEVVIGPAGGGWGARRDTKQAGKMNSYQECIAVVPSDTSPGSGVSPSLPPKYFPFSLSLPFSLSCAGILRRIPGCSLLAPGSSWQILNVI